MELEVDLADAELDELLAAGSRAAKKRQVELAELKEKYEAQLKSLKDLVGDYTDRMELQQNSYKRLTAIAGATPSVMSFPMTTPSSTLEPLWHARRIRPDGVAGAQGARPGARGSPRRGQRAAREGANHQLS